MIKKLVLLTGMLSFLAGCATSAVPEAADSLRNAPGGNIAQFIDKAAAKVNWQIVMADGNACQKFLPIYDDTAEVVKYAVDCWETADSESAKLPVKVALKQKDGKEQVLEAASVEICNAAVMQLTSLGQHTAAGQCEKK